MIKTDVLILGAGVSGLAAAHYLTGKGIDVVVLEKEQEEGGICRTFQKNGFLFDLGGHRFLTNHTEILQLVKNLMGENLTKRPRKSVVYWREEYFSYPLNLRNLNSNLGLSEKINIFQSLLYETANGLVNKQKVVNLEQYLISKFGIYLYESFFKQYNEKLWGIAPSLMSSDWAAERIPNLGYKQIIMGICLKNFISSKSWYNHFYYPQQGGIGQIARELKNISERKGGKFIFNVKITDVHHNGLRISEINCRKGNDDFTLRPKYVISTIPINEIIKIFNPSLDINYLEIDKKLKYRSIRILNLMLKKSKLTDYTWIYVPDKEIIFFRLQEPKNWHPNNVPHEHTSLSLEISCNKGDEIWSVRDEAILKTSLNGLKKIGLNVQNEEIIDYFSSKIEHAYPIYSLGYEQVLYKVDNLLQPIKNLFLTGRQGKFKYVNMDEAMKMGIEVSKTVFDDIKMAF